MGGDISVNPDRTKKGCEIQEEKKKGKKKRKKKEELTGGVAGAAEGGVARGWFWGASDMPPI